MDNVPMPPQLGSVPATVQARVRAAVMAEVRAKDASATRRWMLTVGVAALVLVAASLGSWVTRSGGPPAMRGDRPAGTVAMPNGWRTPKPILPGIDPTQAQRIVDKCVTGTVGSTGPQSDVPRNDMRIYAQYTDAYGTVLWIFGSRIMFTCTAQPGSKDFTADGSFTTAPRGGLGWLTRPVTMDFGGGGPTRTKQHPGPWAETVAGRVAPNVVRVVYRNFGKSVELPVTNGAYVGRIVYPVQATVPADTEVVGYDATGAVVATTPAVTGERDECAVTPDGDVIGYVWPTPKPAACPRTAIPFSPNQ